MSEVILQSDLESFKAKLPPGEVVLAEWFLKALRKGRLISSHHVGSPYLLLCTDTSLYMLKLSPKRVISSHKRYSLLDFTNIQVGYLSKQGEDALDELEVNVGLYAIRLHLGPKVFKTFKHPSSDAPDDIQKAFIQVIFSALKAMRREMYRNSPHHSTTPLQIPTKQPPSPAHTPPSHTPILLKQDSFMISLPGYFLSTTDAHDPIEGVVTITQKHFVFEPSSVVKESEHKPQQKVVVLYKMPDSLTIPLSKVVECLVLREHEITIAREFVMANNSKILQLFAEGSKLCFSLPAAYAENARSRLSTWIQAAQDKVAQEIMSQTAIAHPLLTREDTITNFRGDSDILSAKDVLYLQYKMPERHAMEKWELVYSTTRHGISINTFFTRTAQRAPSLIVVEDTNHHVFGGYATDPWVKTTQTHYGSGESFLFKIKPVCKIFKWSKRNDYFMYSKPDFISMGSGGGGYGLWLDADFEQGSSATSDTFQNEPLSNSEQFTVLKVEVWAPPVFLGQKKTSRPL